MTPELTQRIQQLISQSPVVLFMKGDRFEPKCGFSSHAVSLLNSIKAEYQTFDILEDEDVRQGLKEYSQWPTYPQLYIHGKLIGGADIMDEMMLNGELVALLGKK